MNRQHGITANTYKRLVIDSGAVYKNYGVAGGNILLGATRGGNTFTIESEYREMEVDGAKGPLKGMRRITKVTATLVANFIEISSNIIQMALPGSIGTTTASPASWDIIKRSLEIALTDYVTNIAIIGEVNGQSKPSVLILKNALADGNFEIGFEDNNESVLPVTFKGHFSLSDLDTEPWEIRFPKIV
jgi:hypothetical protein